jgi:hypothetical protein
MTAAVQDDPAVAVVDTSEGSALLGLPQNWERQETPRPAAVEETTSTSLEIATGFYGAPPFGTALADDTGLRPEDVSYDDIYAPGFGWNLHGRLHIFGKQEPNHDWSYGPTVLIDSTIFNAHSWSPVAGYRFKPDSMHIIRGLAGAHVRGTWDIFFAGAHAGIGLAYMDAVDARETLAGVSAKGEVFAETVTVGYELAGRIGGKVVMNPNTAVSIFFTLGLGGMAPPGEGEDLVQATPGVLTWLIIGGGIGIEWGSVE